MKRIGMSKEPTLQIIQNIADNLQTKLNISTLVSIEYWRHTSGHKELGFKISLVDHSAKIHQFKTWPKLIVGYRKLMKGEAL